MNPDNVDNALARLRASTRCEVCGHSSDARNPHAATCPWDTWTPDDPWVDFYRVR